MYSTVLSSCNKRNEDLNRACIIGEEFYRLMMYAPYPHPAEKLAMLQKMEEAAKQLASVFDSHSETMRTILSELEEEKKTTKEVCESK